MIASLLAIWLLIGTRVHARNVALQVHLFRPGEVAPHPPEVARRNFAKAVRKETALIPLTIAASTAEEFEQRWSELGLGEGDRIVRLWIQGHGSLGSVGFLDLDRFESGPCFARLASHLDSGAHVVLYSCSVLPKAEVVAKFIATDFAGRIGLSSGTLHAFFGKPLMINRIPIWELNDPKARRRIVRSVLQPAALYGSLLAWALYSPDGIAPYLLGGYTGIIVFSWTAILAYMNNVEIAKRYDFDDSVVTGVSRATPKSIKRQFFRDCEGRLIDRTLRP